MEPITNKSQMYAKLAAGDFGNTIPQFFSVDDWLASKDSVRYESWGVRTLAPGGPCRLYTPRQEVYDTVADYENQGYRCNISSMVDEVCTVRLWGEAYESNSGLVVYGIINPARGDSWRKRMPYDGKHWLGLDARMLLKRKLNANSYDDLMILLETYPEHIVEFSALEECFGTIPFRNIVTWEVRKY